MKTFEQVASEKGFTSIHDDSIWKVERNQAWFKGPTEGTLVELLGSLRDACALDGGLCKDCVQTVLAISVKISEGFKMSVKSEIGKDKKPLFTARVDRTPEGTRFYLKSPKLEKALKLALGSTRAPSFSGNGSEFTLSGDHVDNKVYTLKNEFCRKVIESAAKTTSSNKYSRGLTDFTCNSRDPLYHNGSILNMGHFMREGLSEGIELVCEWPVPASVLKDTAIALQYVCKDLLAEYYGNLSTEVNILAKEIEE